MDVPDYMTVVDDALTKLEELQRKRDTIDAETMKLEQLIVATANMLPDKIKDLAMRRMATLQEIVRIREFGLTEAAGIILKTATGQWLTVTNVRDRLIAAGFDFSGYTTNPLASISTTLRRLTPEKVESTTIDGGVAAYRWKDTKAQADRIASFGGILTPKRKFKI